MSEDNSLPARDDTGTVASSAKDAAVAQRKDRDWRELLAPIVAIGVLVAFAGFVAFLLMNTDAPDTQWARGIYLFSGVEAIAFAAAGFFFGTEIQRKRAEKAEDRAETAEKSVVGAEKTATQEETKGRALADAIRAKAAAFGPQSAVSTATADGTSNARPEGLGTSNGRPAPDQLEWWELGDLANRLYPQ